MKLSQILQFWQKKNIQKTVEKQLDKNIEAVKSLRDYDQGKKIISTSDIRARLPGIRVTP